MAGIFNVSVNYNWIKTFLYILLCSTVNSSDKSGQVLHLRLHDGSGSILPVYIGKGDPYKVL